ncbi:N-acetylmuramoyl-L-alanine amidase [Clostridium sp. LP20]|uniref:N-acetylmuramoyl-L-alanine amidase n=1 Tax=Clostridium sp. LP20 TaxID=3418665 RepID=UPI003EE71EDF
MKIKTLAIDIGHNLDCDYGAIGIRREDDLNREVGNGLIEICRAVGINVINCTPSSASSLRDSLSQRCLAANKAEADFFISIHHNACPGGYGAEVLCLKGGVAEEVGNVILSEISKLGLRNRGVKDRRDLYVINNTNMKAILIECAFCDSKTDMTGYSTEKMAEAIFNGICRTFDISTVSSGDGGTGSKIYHTVVSGDTLWGISRSYGVSVDRLIEINGIRDRNLISVGQKIRIN